MYEVHLSEITGLLWRNWKRLAWCGFAGLMLVSVISVFLVKREWQASATVLVGNAGQAGGLLSNVLAGVAGGGGGALSSLMTGGGPNTDLFEIILGSWDTRAKVVQENGLQKFFHDKHWQKTVERLSAITKVSTSPPNSVNLTVTFTGTPRGLVNPDDADLEVRELTVKCAQSYLKLLGEALEGQRVSSAKAQRVFLEEQKPKAEHDYLQAQAAVTKWEAEHHLPAPPAAATATTQMLITLQQSLITAQVAQVAQVDAARRATSLLAGQPEMVQAAASETANPELTRLTTALAVLEQQIAEQETFYHKTPEHPDVARLLVQKQQLTEELRGTYQRRMLPATLAQARNTVHDQVLAQLLQAQVQVSAQGATVRGLERALADARKQVEKLTWASLEYARLYEQATIDQAIYETIVKEWEAAILNEKAEVPQFYVVDPPVVPWRKHSPAYPTNAELGLLLGLLFAAVWIVRRPGTAVSA